MPFRRNLARLVDPSHQNRSYAEIAASPLGVLGSLSHGQATKVSRALGAWTIEELATCRPVLWAQAISRLADEEPLDIQRAKVGHVFNPSLVGLLNRKWAGMPLREVAKAPPHAFRGVSKTQSALLKEAIQVETVRDLAINQVVLVTQVITQLARYERVEALRLAA